VPVSREWEQYVLEQLADVGRVRARRMFGGVGLYVEQTFFGLIAGAAGDLFLKVDEGNRGDFEAAGTGPFRPFADQAYAMSYWQVPPDVLEDSDELAAWARKAIAAARRQRATPKARPKATRNAARGAPPGATGGPSRRSSR